MSAFKKRRCSIGNTGLYRYFTTRYDWVRQSSCLLDFLNACGCQVFVHIGDRHAAFTNAAGNAFNGAVAYVPGTEDTGYAGFKRERLAVKRPGRDVAASADVSIGVAIE
jgi:hypothetical protein